MQLGCTGFIKCVHAGWVTITLICGGELCRPIHEFEGRDCSTGQFRQLVMEDLPHTPGIFNTYLGEVIPEHRHEERVVPQPKVDLIVSRVTTPAPSDKGPFFDMMAAVPMSPPTLPIGGMVITFNGDFGYDDDGGSDASTMT